VTVDNPGDSEVSGTLTARLSGSGQEVSVPVTLPPGESRPEAVLEIAQPQLWWPVGQGEAATPRPPSAVPAYAGWRWTSPPIRRPAATAR